MLIVYDRATGNVLDNSGTSSVIPLGPDDERAYVNTDTQGIDRDTLALLRLHDEDDAELVQAALANQHHVDPTTGELVIDGPYPQRTLTADRTTVPADDTTVALVTYTDTHDDAPVEVTFSVNGAEATVPLYESVAELEVVGSVPGQIDVTVDALPGEVVTINVIEEVTV